MSLLHELQTIKSHPEEMRKFTSTMGIASAVFALIFFWIHSQTAIVLLWISLIFFLFRYTNPRLLIPVQKIWMGISLILGFISSHIILLILFYAIVTPIAVASRLLGKRFLELSLRHEKKSYWIPRTSEGTQKKNYEKQF